MVLGKHSGRHAFEDRLKNLGIMINADKLDEALLKFKLLADLSVTQQDDLRASACGGALADPDTCAQARIDWMRGDKTHEEAGGPLRKRARVLGDIISSSPYYVRDTETLYIGSNDGTILEGFKATGMRVLGVTPSTPITAISSMS